VTIIAAVSGAIDAMGRLLNKKRKKYCRAGLVLMAILAVAWPTVSRAQESPSEFDALASQADAARINSDAPHAIQLYSQALKLNPKWGQGWWYLGLLQYETDAYAAAQESLTQYIALDPNAGPATALRGLCEFELGDWNSSLADIERGMSLGAASQPRNEQILRYHEAVLFTRLGKFQDALRAFAWFAKKGITNPDLIEEIGLAGLRMPLLPNDAGEKQRSMIMAVGSAAYQYMGEHEEEAKEQFAEVFKRFPTAPNAHLLYGFLLFDQHPEKAEEEFTHELEISPSNAGANVMLAWACLMKNDPAGALPYAKRAEQEEPAFPAALLVFGRSLVETGDLKNGTHYLERALQVDPGNAEVHIALAQAYSEAGRKEDAWRERMESLQLTSVKSAPATTP
jgi:tetratricopeptide (TPR) repeat protein